MWPGSPRKPKTNIGLLVSTLDFVLHRGQLLSNNESALAPWPSPYEISVDSLPTGGQRQNSSPSIVRPSLPMNLNTEICPLDSTVHLLLHGGQLITNNKRALASCPPPYKSSMGSLPNQGNPKQCVLLLLGT